MAERIKLTDTVTDMIVKLAEGNPGAARVLADIYMKGAKIDPDMGHPMRTLLHFDTLGIYGSRIWMLYKDVCGQNLSHTLACLRAVQLGLLLESRLQHAIDNYGKGVSMDDVTAKVKTRLPSFDLTD